MWLKEIPEYAVLFTQLALINGVIDSSDGPLIAASLATGKIKKYMVTVSLIILANVPISYIALKLGCEPTATMEISIVVSCVAVIIRAYLLKQMMNFPWLSYLLLMAKIAGVTVVMVGLSYLVAQKAVNDFVSFVVYAVFIAILTTALYTIVLSRDDRRYAIKLVKQKFHIK